VPPAGLLVIAVMLAAFEVGVAVIGRKGIQQEAAPPGAAEDRAGPAGT